MIRKFEKQLIGRYKRYSKEYEEYNKGPSSCEAGHLQEISWILHELFSYTDKDIRELEDDIRAEILEDG
ncbi:hypothetical protein [Butyrivibrio sp. INlla21]|uniref:hypothetical protein n=1 Tax=Butyrivibrio sp. INlla21 TaxID=1520811 RepID=UPI0008E2AA69|nr:hypothetical protein [Butyrivibrio sp. INlla21]SFU37599.1 hypothetical protein SAMN02910342_00313 [Butyrivibrio sp. INlla21]